MEECKRVSGDPDWCQNCDEDWPCKKWDRTHCHSCGAELNGELR